MKIQLNVNDDLQKAANRLSDILDVEFGSGIEVNAVLGDRIGASLKEGVGTIYYRERCHFFRELGVFVENARKSDSFDVTEDGFFNTVGLMFNATHTSPKPEAVCKYIDYMALLGYNLLMLYTESNIKLPDRPHFGYMYGIYSDDEIRMMDDYAYDYGIEMMPCLECYGHMQNYLYWPEAADIKDTGTVLLAREPKTFEFLTQYIKAACAPYRSKRVHIGMDEAWNMGRGNFIDKHGLVNAFDIFKEFMQELIGITDSLGLKPMMWSDMYMRHASATGWPYDEKIVVTDAMKEAVPEGVELVFWHYGEDPGCDKYMLEKHNQLGRNVIMATGIWDWSTKLPDNIYAYETTKFSLDSCRKTGVHDMMTTKWNGGGVIWTTLLGLCLSAELCYKENADEKWIEDRFNFISDGAYDAFNTMSQFNNIFDSEHKYDDYSTRFLGHALYWQDILEGLYDTHLFDRPMSAHYAAQEKKLASYEGKWKQTVDMAEAIFSMISKKCEIAEKLWPAYNSADKDTLKYIASEALPELICRIERVHEAERRNFFTYFKQANWSSTDKCYGALMSRAKTAKMLLDAYLAREIDEIDSLKEQRLHRAVNGFLPYKTISSHTP